MSNGRNANHVTLPAVCLPFSIAVKCGRFPSSTFAGSAIMLAICFRLPLTERRRSDCLLFTLLLHHRRWNSDRRTVKWYFGNISHKQIIALSLFTRRRRVARSANYPGHRPDARSCNGTRYVVRQISMEAELACSQHSRLCAVHSADTAVAYVFTHRCTWRRRDAEVRKTFVFYLSHGYSI